MLIINYESLFVHTLLLLYYFIYSVTFCAKNACCHIHQLKKIRSKKKLLILSIIRFFNSLVVKSSSLKDIAPWDLSEKKNFLFTIQMLDSSTLVSGQNLASFHSLILYLSSSFCMFQEAQPLGM